MIFPGMKSLMSSIKMPENADSTSQNDDAKLLGCQSKRKMKLKRKVNRQTFGYDLSKELENLNSKRTCRLPNIDYSDYNNFRNQMSQNDDKPELYESEDEQNDESYDIEESGNKEIDKHSSNEDVAEGDTSTSKKNPGKKSVKKKKSKNAK